jgi:hypothetical protein
MLMLLLLLLLLLSQLMLLLLLMMLMLPRPLLVLLLRGGRVSPVTTERCLLLFIRLRTPMLLRLSAPSQKERLA